MTSHYYVSDDTCLEHQHQRLHAAVLIRVPVLILFSAVGSLVRRA
jgi:hypothetical protein